MLICKFHVIMWTVNVNTSLLRAFYVPLYTAHQWCTYTKGCMQNLK
uniref:Uncharacterized protein n=1 Tax=Anguilla anguilla TaxID=7936 RepID=A0A0E9U9S1_ANGAN